MAYARTAPTTAVYNIILFIIAHRYNIIISKPHSTRRPSHIDRGNPFCCGDGYHYNTLFQLLCVRVSRYTRSRVPVVLFSFTCAPPPKNVSSPHYRRRPRRSVHCVNHICIDIYRLVIIIICIIFTVFVSVCVCVCVCV